MKILSWDVGIYNLAYCILEIDEDRSKTIIHDWDILNLGDSVLYKKDRTKFYENIFLKLDDIKSLLNVDMVLIENQPCMKNPSMKTIQVILYSYFMIKGFHNESNSITRIDFVSPTNKLKCYDGPPIDCTKKSKYAQRKYFAIEHTKYFLKDYPEYLEIFSKNKKKDDLADSFLQALYYKNIKLI